MQNYRLENKLTFGDYMIAMISVLCKPVLQIIYLVIAFLLTWFFFGLTADDFTLSSTVLYCTLATYILLQLVFVLMSSMLQKKNGDMVFKSLGYQYSEITQESYIETYSSSVSEIKWDKFINILETTTHFFLYAEKGRFVILPKRLLPDGCVVLIQAIKNKLKQQSPDKSVSQTKEDIPVGDGDIITRLSMKDYFMYQLYVSFVFRKNTIIGLAVMLLLTFITGLFAMIIGDFIYPIIFVGMLLFMSLFPVFLAFIVGKREARQARWIVYRFRENGFEMEHRLGKVFVQWDRLYAARETAEYYFLFLSDIQAAILPKQNLTPDSMALIDSSIRNYDLKVKKKRAA